MKAMIKALGAILIIVWIVLWLAIKITMGAVHLLLLAGLAILLFGFIKAERN